ncbi:MAG: hypothetical protein ABFE02_11530 [Sulfuricella sp.]
MLAGGKVFFCQSEARFPGGPGVADGALIRITSMSLKMDEKFSAITRMPEHANRAATVQFASTRYSALTQRAGWLGVFNH